MLGCLRLSSVLHCYFSPPKLSSSGFRANTKGTSASLNLRNHYVKVNTTLDATTTWRLCMYRSHEQLPCHHEQNSRSASVDASGFWWSVKVPGPAHSEKGIAEVRKSPPRPPAVDYIAELAYMVYRPQCMQESLKKYEQKLLRTLAAAENPSTKQRRNMTVP